MVSLRKTISRIAAITLEIPNDWKYLNRMEKAQADFVILIDIVIANPEVTRELSDQSYRILVFGTPDLFERLMGSPIWLMDGTFAVAPKIFYQQFTIHCFIGERAIPCVYCLLQKRYLIYQILFWIGSLSFIEL